MATANALHNDVIGGDKRMNGERTTYTSAENDGRAYRALEKLGRPASIGDIWREIPDVAERTVRRSIARLMKTGHVIPAGKDANGGVLYTVKRSMFVDPTSKLVPFNGAHMNVEDFMQLMVDPNVDPFKPRVKLNIWEADFIHWLRRRFLYPIITAGDSGFDQQLNDVREGLVKIRAEAEKFVATLDQFIDSAVWYDHYRDSLALERRNVEKTNPELVKLVMDYMQNKDS